MKKRRELLFSVTKKDFIIEPFKGSGKGGQHRNKTMSCVRIRHHDSGAEAIGTEHREQGRNKKLAFKRITETKKFKDWIKIRTSEIIKGKIDVERIVEDAMNPKNLKIEAYDCIKKKWVVI